MAFTAAEEKGALSDQPSASESKGTKVPSHHVYILRCSDGTLYVGSTDDIDARVVAHNEGRGAVFTANRRPVELAYSEACITRLAARRREAQLKRWTRAKKEALIAGDAAALKRL